MTWGVLGWYPELFGPIRVRGAKGDRQCEANRSYFRRRFKKRQEKLDAILGILKNDAEIQNAKRKKSPGSCETDMSKKKTRPKLDTASLYWPTSHHDQSNWRYSPIDVTPPISLEWTSEVERATLGSEITGKDGIVASHTCNGKIRVFDENGKFMWEGPKGKRDRGLQPPTFVNDVVLLARTDGLYCFAQKTGDVKWKIESDGGKTVNNGKKISSDEWDFGGRIPKKWSF